MILVCGETVLDMHRRAPAAAGADADAACFVALPGGSPANTAVALARLGAESGLCARLSSSTLGALIRGHLSANGVDLRHCVDAPEPASLAFVDLDVAGAASYSFYVEGAADWQWRLEELPADLPDSVSVLHTGSIASMREPGRAAILDWLRRERRGRAVSFDPNVRPALVGPRPDARHAVEQVVSTSDLVKASDEDVGWLYPATPVAQVAARWHELGAAVVVVTSGADGASAYTRATQVSCPARDVAVVDTVGAGDAFAAGLLHHLTREGLLDDLRAARLGADALRTALDYAGAVSALTCSRAGADPPTGAAVDALLAAGG
ncbi:MAG TPA: carbohydrate kinase [Acidimicrobiales bacterium]|nr:carbohydrate kinase [Acidimicrobiales bacterium]